MLVRMVEWLALVLAGGNATWNVFTWLRARRTRVEVELKPILGLESLAGQVAAISLINHSDHEVHPSRIVLELEDGAERYPSLINVPRLAPILVDPIKPRDSVMTIINDDDLRLLNFDRSRPVRARLELANKEVFRSRPSVIDPRQPRDQ